MRRKLVALAIAVFCALTAPAPALADGGWGAIIEPDAIGSTQD
jgi:hypothetical protein